MKDIQARRLYIGADEGPSIDPPVGAEEAQDGFVWDPAHPVPYRQRPIQPTYFPGGSVWPSWLVEDQRFVGGRPDVLSWEGAVLDADLTIAGKVSAHLFATTRGSDADRVVKPIDVNPEQNLEYRDLAG